MTRESLYNTWTFFARAVLQSRPNLTSAYFKAATAEELR